MSPTSCALSIIACGHLPSLVELPRHRTDLLRREVVRQLLQVLLFVGQVKSTMGWLLRGGLERLD